jgi:hypothetical protein
MPRITESVIGSTLGLNPIFVVDLDLRVASLMAFFAGPLLLDIVFSVANALASTNSLSALSDHLYWKLPRPLANAKLARIVLIETTADHH